MTKTLKMKRCTFCCKTQGQVVVLIEGPGTLICNECIVTCVEIIVEWANPEQKKAVVAPIFRALEPVRELMDAEAQPTEL